MCNKIMHKLAKLLMSILICWGFITAIAAQQQLACNDYYNRPGRCVPITACHALLHMESNPNRTYSDLLVLDGSYCASPSGGLKWVCCEDGTPATTQTPTTTTKRNDSPYVIVTPIPRTKREHKLLPDPNNSECGLHFPDKIVGGNETALDEHPWTALIGYETNDNSIIFGCGGSLISNRYVLTAAHCIHTVKRIFVRLGEWNVETLSDCKLNNCNDPVVDVDVEEIIVHSGYNKSNRNRSNDIALLRLSTSVKYSTYIRSICLPLAQDLRQRNDHHQQRYTAVGWGLTQNYTESKIKLKVELPGVSLENCNRSYGKLRKPIELSDKQMCAGGEEGAGSCIGDSGGPLLAVYSPGNGVNYHYLAGVISFGVTSCGKKRWPGVFTNVGSYVEWIQDNIKP